MRQMLRRLKKGWLPLSAVTRREELTLIALAWRGLVAIKAGGFWALDVRTCSPDCCPRTTVQKPGWWAKHVARFDAADQRA